MKKRNALIISAAVIIAAALPVTVALSGALAAPLETAIPQGSSVLDGGGNSIAVLSRFSADADGAAAGYFAKEKSGFTTWFSCFFGEGGSVSERLAYMLYPEGSAARRIAAAKYLEQTYSKEELAGLFCSGAEFAEGIYGVDNAAAYYFGCTAQELTETQLEALGDIFRSEKYRGMTPAELAEQERFAGLSLNPDYEYVTLYRSDYLTGVIEELRNALTGGGMTREAADRLIFCEGLEITVPMDAGVQKALDDTIRNGGDTENFQIGAQIMDYRGNVLGCVGSIGCTGVNHTQKPLSPGSSIKPLSVYAPAIEEGLITYSDMLPDYPYNMELEWPKNYNGIFEEKVTIAHALRQSKNTTAVFIADRLGVENCGEYLRRCGLTHISGDDFTLMGMGLGYMNSGVTVSEMNAAYAVFGNGGYYYAPTFVTCAKSGGETVYSSEKNPVQVFSEETAWIMNRLMKSNVDRQDGLGSAAYMEGTEVYGKSGTTDRDNEVDNTWFVAGCPDYVTAVWIGLDYQEENHGMPSCAALCNILMSKLDMEKTEFEGCGGVISAEFCTASGKLRGERCADVETGWYKSDNVPEKCTECG